MRENIKVGRGSQTDFSTIAAIDSLELCRNAMGHHPSQAGLSDLWMRISAELPAHPGHFSSDAAAFGWLYGSSKLEKIILALGYNSWILMDNIEREPGPCVPGSSSGFSEYINWPNKKYRLSVQTL